MADRYLNFHLMNLTRSQLRTIRQTTMKNALKPTTQPVTRCPRCGFLCGQRNCPECEHRLTDDAAAATQAALNYRIKEIITATIKEFAADADEEIIDCQTNADTGRGISRTELDSVPAVFEELADLNGESAYQLGNACGWSMTGLEAAEQIAVRRVWDALRSDNPEIEYDEAQKLVSKTAATVEGAATQADN